MFPIGIESFNLAKIETFIADKYIIELYMKMCLFEMHNLIELCTLESYWIDAFKILLWSLFFMKSSNKWLKPSIWRFE